MRFSIITGMSGAGKSTVLRQLEDYGYFCIDNLPLTFLDKLVDIAANLDATIEKVALGLDVRSGNDFKALLSLLERLKTAGHRLDIVYMEASDSTLIKRYKETRRRHPLISNEVDNSKRVSNQSDKQMRLIDVIAEERLLLASVKDSADYIIDTTTLLTRELKEKIYDIFVEGKKYDNLMVTLLSFGYKHGIPSDADLVFDVRFIPNPFYLPNLKEKTGQQTEVREYVMKWNVTEQFISKIDDLLTFLLPNYVKEGKNQMVIAIGCTGGKHRSVVLTEEIYQRLKMAGYSVSCQHRDIVKDRLHETVQTND